MFEEGSLIFRYIFVLLGGLLAALVLLGFIKDSIRYRKALRRLPDAGRIGILRCDTTGMEYPLTREGYIGRSLSCDIRVKGNGIRQVHAVYSYVPGKGLKMRPVGRNTLVMAGQTLYGSAIALHGTHIQIGSVPFTVLFFEGLDAEDPADLHVSRKHTTRSMDEAWEAQPTEEDFLWETGASNTDQKVQDPYDPYENGEADPWYEGMREGSGDAQQMPHRRTQRGGRS